MHPLYRKLGFSEPDYKVLERPLDQEGKRQRVAPGQAAVRAGEELEMDARGLDAGREHLSVERGGAELEVVLVVASGVDPDRSQIAQRLSMGLFAREHHRVEPQPARPHLRVALAGLEIERELDRAVVARRVRRAHGIRVHEQLVVRRREHRPPREEVRPEASNEPS